MTLYFVNPRLAFGSKVRTKKHVERLRALGITHVMNLRFRQLRRLRAFRTLWLGFPDNAKPRPAWFYRRALKFYRKAMKEPDAKVFVMCRGGLCRSPSMVYFLLRTSGLDPKKAEAVVIQTRPRARVGRAYRESAEEFLQRFELKGASERPK